MALVLLHASKQVNSDFEIPVLKDKKKKYFKGQCLLSAIITFKLKKVKKKNGIIAFN